MPTSVPVPAAEMTQSPEHMPDEPAARTADAAEPAGRAPGLIRRARAAARPVSSKTPFMTVIVLLATGLSGFVLRDLNSIEADIDGLNTEVAQLHTNVALLHTEVALLHTKVAQIDARFDDVDARFAKLETEVDARFDALEAGQQEIALTLVALVAYLRADEGVGAALAGRLPDPVAGTGTDPSP